MPYEYIVSVRIKPKINVRLSCLQSFAAAAEWLTTFAVLGKMGIAISFTTAYVYSVEIFPTSLRNIGIGSSSMCARISGMIAPFMGEPLVRMTSSCRVHDVDVRVVCATR